MIPIFMKTDDASRFPFHRPMSINVQTTISDRVRAAQTIDRCPRAANLGKKGKETGDIRQTRGRLPRSIDKAALFLSLSLSSPIWMHHVDGK